MIRANTLKGQSTFAAWTVWGRAQLAGADDGAELAEQDGGGLFELGLVQRAGAVLIKPQSPR